MAVQFFKELIDGNGHLEIPDKTPDNCLSLLKKVPVAESYDTMLKNE